MSEFLKDKRVFITGINGQVGGALVEELKGRCEVITAARQGADYYLDLENPEQIRSVITEVKPDIVINPAAYTQVDQAEVDYITALKINGEAPGVIAEVCNEIGATLIHYSTDYVFEGNGKVPYREDDATEPVNAYGRSKLEGERQIAVVGGRAIILRACWVYDRQGKNFLNAILNQARKNPTLKVVSDQYGTPTSAAFIAKVTRKILESLTSVVDFDYASNMIFHLSPNGYCTWYDFASMIIEEARESESLVVEEILKVKSDAFPTRAVRPKWSVFDNSKLCQVFGMQLPDWQECLKANFKS